MNIFKIKCRFNKNCRRDIINPLIMSTDDMKSYLKKCVNKLRDLRHNLKNCYDIPSVLSLKSDKLTFRDNFTEYLISNKTNECNLEPATCYKKYKYEKRRKRKFENLLRRKINDYNIIQDLIRDLESYSKCCNVNNITIKHDYNCKTNKDIILVYSIKSLAERGCTVWLFYGNYIYNAKCNMHIVYHELSGSIELMSIDSDEKNKGYGSILLKHLKLITKELNHYLEHEVDKCFYLGNPVKYISGSILNKTPEQYRSLKIFYEKNGFLKDGRLYYEVN